MVSSPVDRERSAGFHGTPGHLSVGRDLELKSTTILTHVLPTTHSSPVAEPTQIPHRLPTRHGGCTEVKASTIPSIPVLTKAPATRIGLCAGLIAATVALAGCTTAEPTVDVEPSTPSFSSDLAELVPESIKTDGILTIGTDPNYAPMEFTSEDGLSVTGADIDLATGVAQVLGLSPRFEREAYTTIPTSIRTGRFELGIASLTIPPDKKLRTDAILYFESGTQLARSKQSLGLTPENMCGFKIASLEGSIQVAELALTSKTCRSRGQASVQINAMSSQDAVAASVVNGSSDGLLADFPVTQLAVRENPESMELAGPAYDKAPLGMLTSADFRKFTRAVQGAVQLMMDSGYYRQVLDSWHISSGALVKARIRRAAK